MCVMTCTVLTQERPVVDPAEVEAGIVDGEGSLAPVPDTECREDNQRDERHEQKGDRQEEG